MAVMYQPSLTCFLNGELQPNELWRDIEAEVTGCIAACAKGSSGHVVITDGPNTQVSRMQIAVLLDAIVDAKLSLAAASYIADALIMSDDFEWEDQAVSEALFFLSDESEPLTLAEVDGARRRLATASS